MASLAAGGLLGYLPQTHGPGMPPSVRTQDIFGYPPHGKSLPLNAKTTAHAIREDVPFDQLEPRQPHIPIAGLEAYLQKPRRGAPDVVRVVHPDGSTRYLIQEGHTRLGAAKLRGSSRPVRVWEFVQNPATGMLEPVPRGLHEQGVSKIQLDGTSEGAIKGWESRRGGGGDQERVSVGGRDVIVTHSKRAAGAGDVLVPIDMAKFDEAWRKDTGFHIDPSGSNKIGSRLERAQAFLKTTDQMDAAEVTVQRDGRVGFTDGRHRMAVLRDAGVKRVPVSMTAESLANAKKHGLVHASKMHLGGQGSGNFGHAGRPGEIGGSGSGGELTASDVGDILADQYNQRQAREEQKSYGSLADTTRYEAPFLQDKFVVSQTFRKMEIPIDAAAPLGNVHEGAESKTSGPIIVDANKGSFGRRMYGAPPRLVVLDGKHRLAQAKARGDKTITAYVGEEAVQHLKPKIQLGGQGSGNFGHAGRPGEIGGSGGGSAKADKAAAIIADAKADGRPVLFHSGDASIDDQLASGIEPQFGSWLEEVLSGATDEDELAQEIRDQDPVTFFSTEPDWVAMKTARAVGKSVGEVTLDDIRKHGQLSVVSVAARDPAERFTTEEQDKFTDEEWKHQESLTEKGTNPDDFLTTGGKYNEDVVPFGGKAPRWSDHDVPFGVEPKDIFSKSTVVPDVTLTGDALIAFMQAHYPQHLPGGKKKLTYRAKLAFLLGGEGSGNFGHTGRPGEVGGSGGGVPPKPGTTPIPPGMIRAYHYTNAGEDALHSILEHGLSREFARGSTYGEPNQIWFSTTKPGDFKNYVEVHLDPKELHGGDGGPSPRQLEDASPAERQRIIDDFNEPGNNFTVGVDKIPPSRIVTHSEPWMAVYHQTVHPDNPAMKEIYDEKIKEIVAGDLDHMIDSDPRFPKVFAAIKAKFGKKKELTYRAKLAVSLGDVEGHPFRGNQWSDEGEGDASPAPTHTGKDVKTKLAPALADVAQKVYDKWDEDPDCYAGGGICHIIAEEIAGKLGDHGIEAQTVSSQIGEQHVWVVAKLKDGVYSIDVPPDVYETGGGYSWKKVKDVQITKDDVVVDKIDGNPDKFGDYIDMSADPINLDKDALGHGSDPKGERGPSAPAKSGAHVTAEHQTATIQPKAPGAAHAPVKTTTAPSSGKTSAASVATAGRHPEAPVTASTPGAVMDYGYGNRYGTHTPKGLGYFGPLKRADGGVMTEFSVGVNIGGKEQEVPTFVPTLTPEELAQLLALPDGQPVPDAVVKKAMAHAAARIAQGLDPFAQPGEQATATYPQLVRAEMPTGKLVLPKKSSIGHPVHRPPVVKKLTYRARLALLLDKDEHGYGSYHKSERGGQARAKAGGEYGPNDDWYPGGAFIATSDMPKRERAKIDRMAANNMEVVDIGGQRQKIEPGQIPIVRDVGTAVNRDFSINETYLDRAGYDDEHKTQIRAAASRAVKGERLFDIKEFPALARVDDVVRLIAADKPVPGAALDRAMKYRPDLGKYLVRAKPLSLGGAGSGNFGHAGRPGEVGGSGGGDNAPFHGDTWKDPESALAAGLERAGLPAGMNIHPSADSTIEALSEGRWDIEAKPHKYHDGSWDLEVKPKLPEGIKTFHEPSPYSGTVYYDPRLGEEKPDPHYPERHFIGPKEGTGWTTDIPAKREDGVLYRGMRHEEYEDALRKGTLGSAGDYNFENQQGLTYYSVDPQQAEIYSSGFASWQHTATFDRPAIVVRVKDPGTARKVPGTGSDERGIPGAIKTEDITDVYVGRPYSVKPGHVELYDDYDRKTGKRVFTEGSRGSPSSHLVWKRIDPRDLAATKKLSYRAKLAFVLGDFEGHPFRGNQHTGGSGVVPPEPGSTPIPEGMIRGYHYTSNMDAVEKEGLDVSHARGHLAQEPNAIWFSTAKPSDVKDYIEVFIDPKEIGRGSPLDRADMENTDAPHVRARIAEFNKGQHDFALYTKKVPPDRIVTTHRPWHDHYRYFEANPDAREGVLTDDWGLDSPEYGPAIRAIRAKYGAKKLSFREHLGRKLRLTMLARNYSITSDVIELGGPGSGNFGHAGRPGEVGGSGGGDGGGDGRAYRHDPDPHDFIAARDRSTRQGYLSPLSVDDLKGQKLYLSKDGTVGGAMTPDKDMGNLFNNGGPKGAAHDVLIDMIKDGGKTADAFDGYLPTLYANFGLQETGRMKFNPAYAPPGWNFERDDHPDVVFLARTGKGAEKAGSADDIRGRVKDKGQWIAPERTTKYYDDYDEAKRDATAAADAGGARTLSALRADPRRGVGREVWGERAGTGAGLRGSVTYRDRLAVLLGDFPGHPFRGNQWAGGGGGQFEKAPDSGSGGGPTFHAGMRPASEADADRVKALKVPPGWKQVQLSHDPHADLQATGIDAAGRKQYLYSAKHAEKAAAQKFARLKEFNQELPKLRDRIETDMRDKSLPAEERESAVMLHVIDKTAFRPGSDSDTGAKKFAYGVTTLEGRHVKVDGDKVKFRFRGKDGVLNAKTITDPALAQEFTRRKETVGPNEPLFPTASDGDMRNYLHSRDGDFKPKDFRTWHGTNEALKAVAKMKAPTTEKEFKAAQKKVAKVVSAHLGNTPAVALRAYIDPAVFSPWKAKMKP